MGFTELGGGGGGGMYMYTAGMAMHVYIVFTINTIVFIHSHGDYTSDHCIWPSHG